VVISETQQLCDMTNTNAELSGLPSSSGSGFIGNSTDNGAQNGWRRLSGTGNIISPQGNGTNPRTVEIDGEGQFELCIQQNNGEQSSIAILLI